MKMNTQMPIANKPRVFPSLSSLSSSGVLDSCSLPMMLAILPTSVSMLVAVTTPTPRPYVTRVDMNAELFRSPREVSSSCTSSASLLEGTDSPVREDSSTCRFADSINRISAAINRPVSSTKISPGTRVSESTSLMLPSRFTIAFGEAIFCKASMAFPALIS